VWPQKRAPRRPAHHLSLSPPRLGWPRLCPARFVIFGGPAEPVMSTEMVTEEAFIYLFCDLRYGGGWMEIERDVRGEKRENEVTRNAVGVRHESIIRTAIATHAIAT
jgi:hypothetical protein